MKGIFISGTSTDVGKTVVCAALARALREAGVNTAVVKLVQTGCDADLNAPDLKVYLQSGCNNANLFCFHKYIPACSPHLAARLVGEDITLDSLAVRVEALSAKYDFVLIEGAGGLLVPVNEHELMIELPSMLEIPVLLVVGNVLGAINHALLSIEALKSRSIAAAGIVMNNCMPPDEKTDFIRAENARIIASMSGVGLVAELDYIGNLSSGGEDVWNRLAAKLMPLARRITL